MVSKWCQCACACLLSLQSDLTESASRGERVLFFWFMTQVSIRGHMVLLFLAVVRQSLVVGSVGGARLMAS